MLIAAFVPASYGRMVGRQSHDALCFRVVNPNSGYLRQRCPRDIIALEHVGKRKQVMRNLWSIPFHMLLPLIVADLHRSLYVQPAYSLWRQPHDICPRGIRALGQLKAAQLPSEKLLQCGGFCVSSREVPLNSRNFWGQQQHLALSIHLP